MKTKANTTLAVLVLILSAIFNFGQAQEKKIDKLSVFLDCGNGRCDRSFLREQLNFVDHLNDRVAADVHILISSNRTASAARNYQVIFYGQKEFSGMKDTIRFSTVPNVTDFEIRDELLSKIKIGLVPFFLEKGDYKAFDVTYKGADESEKNEETTDNWNYWVFRVGGNGSINADQNYQSYRFNGDLSASRVTEDKKIGFEYGENVNTSYYHYMVDTVEMVDTVANSGRWLEHYNVFAINDHWSYAYQAGYSKNTFSNTKSDVSFRTGFEYSIFPYKDFNNKLVTVRYILGLKNLIYDTLTIFNKENEFLPFQDIELGIELTQKWGNVELGMNYKQYLHDTKFYNVNVFGDFDVRITGGLSIYCFMYGSLMRDQFNLRNDTPDPTQVLTRQRELLSSYNVGMHFGINYRFGSKLANFNNPRFDQGGAMFFF